jgi:hypothetical protein
MNSLTLLASICVFGSIGLFIFWGLGHAYP